MKYFVLYSFFIVLILKPSFLQSQGTIQGQVLDQDKQVLSFVSVQIKGSTDGTLCDELGKFQISTTIPATLILTFSKKYLFLKVNKKQLHLKYQKVIFDFTIQNLNIYRKLELLKFLSVEIQEMYWNRSLS
jgi:hypothetical protein